MTFAQATEWVEFLREDDGDGRDARDPDGLDDPPSRVIKVRTPEEFEAAVAALRGEAPRGEPG